MTSVAEELVHGLAAVVARDVGVEVLPYALDPVGVGAIGRQKVEHDPAAEVSRALNSRGAAQGQVLCWGSNSNNQLGHSNLGDPTCGGGSTPCDGPTLVGTLDDAGTPFSGAVQISLGQNFACALKADGTVWCWGSGANGRLGHGATTDSPTPVQVLGLP